MSRSMGERRSRGAPLMAMLAVGLAANLAACVVEDDPPPLEPALVLEGEGVGSDPKGTAAYAIDFGTVAVGSRAAPEIWIVNQGSEELLAEVDGIVPPFAVGTDSFELEPRQRQRIELTMAPPEAGTFETLITLRTNELPPGRTVRLFGRGVRGELDCTPAELDLGEVEQGEPALGEAICINPLAVPLAIRLGAFTGDHAEHFSAELQGGDGVQAQVPAGGSIGIAIGFSSDEHTGDATATLPILDGDGGPLASLDVRAHALDPASLGPPIVCAPDRLDFGPVAIGMSSTRSFRCENAAPEESPPRILYVSMVDTSAPGTFDATIRNDDGSDGPKMVGYLPGEAFEVVVTYHPGPGEGLDEADVVVESNSAASPMFAVSAVGQARYLDPCAFDLGPPRLDFGEVAPGSQRTLTAYVVNHTATDCLIHDLRLSEESDPAFSVEEVEWATVGAGERFPVEVTFAPTSLAASLAGAVEFSISDPSDPAQSLALTGIAQEPCLWIGTEAIDFGRERSQCGTDEATVTLANGCATPLRIDDIAIDAAYPQFTLRSLPSLPARLEVGERLDISVSFLPDGMTTFAGAIAVEASDLGDGTGDPIEMGPYVVPLWGEGTPDEIRTDSFTQPDTVKVDVLWVVDNSEPMAGAPGSVHVNTNIGLFTHYLLEREGVDFQLGVTSSGVSYAPSSGCPGGFDGNEDGRLFPHPSLGHPRILTSTMSPAEVHSHFSEHLEVGICHDAPAMYEAARRALSPPWIDTPAEQGGNLGFLRDDADLSIVLVTNGDDRDSLWEGDAAEDRSVRRYVDHFRSLKPSGREEAVKIHAISGGATSCTGNGGALACPRCLEGTWRTGGTWLEICTELNDGDAWGGAFEQMVPAGRSRVFALRRTPADAFQDGVVDEFDLTVWVDGQPRAPYDAFGLPVWIYDPQENAVVFEPTFEPGPGESVEVTYAPTCVTYD